MKLLDYYYDYDYGHDLYLILGQTKWFNLFDVIVHTTEFWSWSPNLRLTLGLFDGKVFSFEINIWSLSLGMDFISYRSPMDLSHTRE